MKAHINLLLFECTKQCLLSPLENVSANPGCESLTLKDDGGFYLNFSIKEVLEIYMSTCDLSTVTMNAKHGS